MGLMTGAPAPLFKALSPVNPQFALSSVGGRYVVLAFLPEPGPERLEPATRRLVSDPPKPFKLGDGPPPVEPAPVEVAPQPFRRGDPDAQG